MIWRGTQDDYPKFYRLCHAFNNVYYHVPLNGEKLERWYDVLLNNGVVFFSDNGFIAGLEVEDPVRDWTFLLEHAWYAEDETGSWLLRRFIRHGQERSVDEVRMCTLDTSPRRASELLLRLGFREADRSYSLNL